MSASGRLWLPLLGVLGAVVAWGLIETQRGGPGGAPAAGTTIDAERIRSVAYVAPGEREDLIRIPALDGDRQPETIAAIPHAFGLHARGSASPTGQLLAVLSVGAPRASATLSLIDPGTGTRREIDGAFDYFSATAWSADGRRLSLVRSDALDDAGRVDAHIFEIDTATLIAAEIAVFERVLEAAPVGYGPTGELLVVVVDQSGSALWAIEASGPELISALSAGRTQSWKLDTTGSRLAFVEAPGPGRTRAGHTLLIRTGKIVSEPGAGGDHIGVAWLPDGAAASFGGPGGSLATTAPEMSQACVVPDAWSPDRTTLAAKLVIPQAGGGLALSTELVTPETRERLAPDEDARFLGWVINRPATERSE